MSLLNSRQILITLNYIHRILIVFGFLISYQISFAQYQDLKHNWVANFDIPSLSSEYNIVADPFGNVFITGHFTNTLAFPPSSGIDSLFPTALGAVMKPDIFISKIDSSGNFKWAKQIGSEKIDETFYSTIDKNGNVYITGFFQDSVDFDPGPGTFYMYGEYLGTIGSGFILKLNNNGEFQWAKRLHNFAARARGTSIDISANGNLMIAGEFKGNIDFDPGPGSYFLESSGQLEYDLFLLMLDTSGNFQWAKSIESQDKIDPERMDVALNSSEVILVGEFVEVVDFNPDTIIQDTLEAISQIDGFLLKLGLNGDFKSIGHWGSEGSTFIYDIDVDSLNNLYFCGMSWGQDRDLDPGSNLSLIPDTAGNQVYFIGKLDSFGTLIWTSQYTKSTGAFSFQIIDLAVDKNLNIYATGDYSGNVVDFDPDTNSLILSSNCVRHHFIHKLDKDGNTLLTKSFSGDLVIPPNLAMAISDNGHIFITGSNFPSLPIDYDPGYKVNQVVQFGNYYVSCFSGSLCSSTYGSYNTTSCGSYTSLDNANTWYKTGIYTEVLQNSNGCDSVITTSLILIDINDSIHHNTILNELYSNVQSATFRWLDCNNGLASIPGETGSSFTPNLNGSFCVEITKGVCIDTTDCITISNVGLSDRSIGILSLYPNPTMGNLNIEFANYYSGLLFIYNAEGKQIQKSEIRNQKSLSLSLDIPSGVYDIRFETTNGITEHQKLVIQ